MWIRFWGAGHGAMTKHTVDACKAKLEECDLVILLVAFRYGYKPKQEQGGNGKVSITAIELQHARLLKKDILIFMADENKPWPVKYCDSDRTEITNFRNNLDQPAAFFEYEDPAGKESDILPLFRSTVLGALVAYKEELLKKEEERFKKELLEKGGAALQSSGGLENFPLASKRLLSGRCIPFLGPGVYGQGPLSTCALRKDLGDESCKLCDDSHRDSCLKSCLATAAEFQERSPDRDLFLDDLKQIIYKQSSQAETPKVYDLIQQIKPPLIVSATLDLLLETKLWDNGNQRCLILCHAIRSRDKQDGILVFKGPHDDSPNLLPATDIPTINLDEEEKLPPEKRAYIVYKPLGSPLLPSGEIDTVVITEEDHAILLRRLGSKESGVPLAFTTCFRDYPPIFLGYPMDVWHFSLIGQFFKSYSSGGERRFAVRIPELPLEKKAWKGLGVELVNMDLMQFSEKVAELSQKVEIMP
jgi:hypothetical protein